ncbi:restriction endonuclease subunit S [uncultured Microbacterium sp.]|uniref:restriction endonuclease subunit S n=1 Tax=uncultured Microbacterium sp. TaxID=191216 RepID=UPI00262D6216|nr:restriction endonuclease subunit S [uncultured Microbacterium sp.]
MTWPTGRLSQLAEAWPSNVDKHSVEGESRVRLCNYTDVYKNDAITESLDFMVATASEDQIDRFSLKVGDTIITKDSETADDIGIPAFVSYEAPDLICGYHLAIVRPIEAASSRYVYWALRSDFVLRQWSVLASGVTRVALRRNDVSRVTVPIPPVEDQQRIADYLDRETAQIDTLIAKQEQLIATLRERRTSAVEHAVLEGIDPHVPRAGGPDSAPHAPAHWRRARISQIATLSSGATPDTDNLEFWASPGDAEATPWVAIGDMSKRDTVTHTMKSLTPHGMASKRLTPGEPGTILFAMYASVGEVAAVEVPAVWNQAILGITPDASRLFLRYLFHLLRALKPFLLRDVRSNTQSNLNAGQVGGTWIPLPPLDEQERIATHLDATVSKIDTLIAKAERFIELSKERRAALITAAVTGQIDIPA